MANDDFDNRRTDDEMLAKLQAQMPPKPSGPTSGRITIKTWPHVAQIFLNREAAKEMARALVQAVEITTEPTQLCVTLTDAPQGTSFMIQSDDRSGTPS